MTPKLALVEQADAPDQPTDITGALRRDIEARDWARVHIAGDRAKPVSIADRIKRVWR
jgi:hypothetical protein